MCKPLLLALLLWFGSLSSASAQMPMPPDLCAGNPAATVIPAGESRVLSGTLVIPCLSVKGTVTVADGTTLTVTTLQTHDGSTFTVGTDAQPARNVIIQTSNDAPTDPEQFGTGLIFSGGTVTLHGLPKVAWGELAAEVQPKANTLTLGFDPQGWAIADRVLVPDTRDRFASFLAQTPEICTITRIVGRTVTCAETFAVEHPGARNAQGVVEWYPKVANLSRSITIRSLNPQGVRGHLMFTTHAKVTVHYVRVEDFGRTTIAPLNPKTNHIGRYAWHVHFLEQSGLFVGNVVERGARWGFTVHHSNNQILRDNVSYDTQGSGFNTEDGTETDNVFDHNFCAVTTGTGERGDERFGFTPPEIAVNGSCYWFNSPSNIVRNNFGANAQKYTYTVWGGGVFHEFANNEAVGSPTAFSSWYTGDPVIPSFIDHFVEWHHWQGSENYPDTNIVYRDWVSRGDPRVQSPNYYRTGWEHGDYDAVGAKLIRPDIQNVRTGVSTPYGVGGQLGPLGPTATRSFTIEDAHFDGNLVNVAFPAKGGSYPPDYQPQMTVVVRNSTMGTLRPDGLALWKRIEPSQSSNIVQLRRLLVQGFNGTAGDDFEVYASEQAPSFVIPVSGLGTPEPGLTNEQAWLKHRVAVLGAVAPCSETRPGVAGFVCTGAVAPPTPVPTPVPVPTPEPPPPPPGGGGGGGVPAPVPVPVPPPAPTTQRLRITLGDRVLFDADVPVAP